MRKIATRESVIEKKSCLLAKQRGWFQVKIEKASMRGFPDRLFVKQGRVVFVEFKNENGRLSDEQIRVISVMRDEYGAEVWVLSSLEEANALFD